MPLAWIPLLESALRNLASRHGVFIAPQSWCMITDGPEIAHFQDGSELDTTHYVVNAILCNQYSQTCDERTFLVPSEHPHKSLTNYSCHFDNTTGVIHVVNRPRCVTFGEISLLQKESLPASPASSTAQKTSVKVRLPFQEKGARLTIDALASMQQDLIDSPPETRSSPSESHNDTSSTPVSSATSSNFPSASVLPDVAMPNTQKWCTKTAPALAGNTVRPNITQVTSEAVQDLPTFQIEAEDASFCCRALDLLEPHVSGNLVTPLAFLDLATSKLKDVAYTIQKAFPLASPDSPQVEITLDEGLGELYLQSIPAKPLSQSTLSILNLDALFEDDDDLDFQPVIPKVKLPIHPPPEDTTKSDSLDLRRGLTEDTVQVLDQVNTCYRNIWHENHGNGDVDYDEATYDAALQHRAVTRFEYYNFTIPRDTLQLVRPFILEYLKIWCEGPGLGGRWAAGLDEPKVSDIAVQLIEWQQMVRDSEQTRSVQLRPVSIVPQEKDLLSSFNWFLQALGGDGQYREHRRVEVVESVEERSQYDERLLHHLNFNGDEVYQRSYTPPEVSFWASATTSRKTLVHRPSLPPQNEDVPLKPLPVIHLARVLTAQAFKWVDPTKYTGTNIFALRKKKGSVMRDAATSDVHIVYPQLGTWNTDQYSDDDVIPRVAPSDRSFEFFVNGNYKFPQYPHYIDDSASEHQMITLNMAEQPKHYYRNFITQIRSPTSLLQYELGAALARKGALLEARLENRVARRQSIGLLDIIEQEVSDGDAKEALRDRSKSSKAARDIVDAVETDHEPLKAVELTERDGAKALASCEDLIVEEEDNSSEAAAVIQVAAGFDQELPSLPKDTDLEAIVPALEDGRYLSPSKMDPSRVNLDRTPPQSPSKADDLGSWEQEQDGNFVSPCKFTSSPNSLVGDEDDAGGDLCAIEYWTDPFSIDSANTSAESISKSVRYPSVQLIRKPSDDDDGFQEQQAVNVDVSITESGDIDVNAEIEEGFAAIARATARWLQSRAPTEYVDDSDEIESEEEKESFDGDNGITDHSSVWAERSDRVANPNAEFLARFAEKEKPKLAKRSNPQEPHQEFLARFADTNPAQRSERAISFKVPISPQQYQEATAKESHQLDNSDDETQLNNQAESSLVRVLKTNPMVTDAEFEEVLLGKFAQEQKKKSGMTVTYDPETAKYHVSPHGGVLLHTHGTTSIEQQEESWESSEGPSPTASGLQSDNSSEQLSVRTSPPALDGEDTDRKEHKAGSFKISRHLDIDETCPAWMPLAHCWKHIAVAVNSLPRRTAESGSNAIITYPEGAPSSRGLGAVRGWKKVGEMQWVQLTESGVDLAVGSTLEAKEDVVCRSGYANIAIAVGHIAIELASWVFWKCLW